jgi:hypothetical protein
MVYFDRDLANCAVIARQGINPSSWMRFGAVSVAVGCFEASVDAFIRDADRGFRRAAQRESH